MKKTNLLATVVFSMLFSGCAIENAYVPPAKPQPLPPGQAPVRTVTQANANFSVSSEVSTKLRVRFKWTSGEQTFASKLAERLAGNVVLEKAEIVLNSKGDAFITIDPAFELIDKTRNYYRINCKQISVAIASNHKIYAIKTVELKPMPRKLGAQNAKDQYLAPAVEAIAPFLKNELERISREEFSVSILNFALANVQEHPESQYVSAQINRIAEIMRTTPGIVNFENIRQDVSSATCSFRVVYLKDRFPQGLSNVLNTKLAGK